MSKKKIYIFTFIAIFILIIGFSVAIYTTYLSEDKSEESVGNFFNVLYNVTPQTVDEILNKSTTDTARYVKSGFGNIYTQDFYDQFFIGDRYLMFLPMIAKENNLTVTCSNVVLKETSMNDKDKYYDFNVEIIVKDNISGDEKTLINKGQIRLKRIYFKYKIQAIKFYNDKFVTYIK